MVSPQKGTAVLKRSGRKEYRYRQKGVDSFFLSFPWFSYDIMYRNVQELSTLKPLHARHLRSEGKYIVGAVSQAVEPRSCFAFFYRARFSVGDGQSTRQAAILCFLYYGRFSVGRSVKASNRRPTPSVFSII